MQAPIRDNKRYVLFASRDTSTPYKYNFGTFEEAWEYGREMVQTVHTMGAISMTRDRGQGTGDRRM